MVDASNLKKEAEARHGKGGMKQAISKNHREASCKQEAIVMMASRKRKQKKILVRRRRSLKGWLVSDLAQPPQEPPTEDRTAEQHPRHDSTRPRPTNPPQFSKGQTSERERLKPSTHSPLSRLQHLTPSVASRRQLRGAVGSVAPSDTSCSQHRPAISSVPHSAPSRPQPLRMSPPSSSASEKAIEKR
ncbi:uncharacterized protein DS421_7g206540 [Arachis hypogaea]|nr:uncharacterized protein DS421_7g206540 [Arachis hypogaea]